MRTEFDLELEERLVRYAAIDSQSDAESPSTPSTSIQFDMLNLLKAELEDIGASDMHLTDYGVVLATIPGTASGPTIGMLAHVDTAPQFNATGVKPRVIKGYNGGDITFPDDPSLVLSPDGDDYLASKVGHDLITASGTTLLGADDKAGISIIMTAARHLLENRRSSMARFVLRSRRTKKLDAGWLSNCQRTWTRALPLPWTARELARLSMKAFLRTAQKSRSLAFRSIPAWPRTNW